MADLIEYKCPSCGGKLEFNSAAQKMKCPFCLSEFDPADFQQQDDDLEQKPAENSSDSAAEDSAESGWTQSETEGLRVYKCQSCGGEVVGDETMAAGKCPYCDNPVIMTGQFSGDLKPDLVIPFKLDKEAAKKALLQHMEGKPLLPKIFKSENHIDEIKGIYVPVWLFNAEADAQFRYEAKKIRRWTDRDFSYTETSVFHVDRAGTISFENVPVDGSSKMDNTLMESLEPFDCKAAVPFQTAFLSGYLADRYDADGKACQPRAEERIKQSTRQEFAKTVQGYDAVNPEHEDIRLTEGKTQYALYPVWLLNTSWNGNKYTFAMNGQTGKFVGDLPSDKGKAWAIFLAVTAAVTVVSYLIGMMLK